MKLFTKLTLFITLSKMVIAILFVLLLPFLVEDIAFRYNDYYLKEQRKKVLNVIWKNGIDAYLQGEENYGSYTMLKEEYISMEPAGKNNLPDTIATLQRVVEGDTLTYRVLSHIFDYHNRRYMLEVGKKTATISQYNRPLQKVALYVLFGLIVFTTLVDLIFTRLLLRPLGVIISTKLVNRKFPFKDHIPPIRTTTTDFRYLDDSLIELMGKIKEAFEKEREFTSNASHELMTPIAILQNKMENLMVEDSPDEELQKKIVGMMKTLNRLKKIVHSLLLISRIENDQFSKTDSLSPYTLVTDVMEELEHRLEEKQLRFNMNISRQIILHNLNHDLIFQLVYNILNNAIKYNKPGGQIMAGDKLIPGEAYQLIISDTGMGISEQEIGTIFNRFKKVVRTEQEGYGLGLSIVSTIAEYHDIKITVSSTVNAGSTFIISFPS
ncbi:signal transduction histidine kinase [Chitinophaga niastensis]|uniref:histidine kinase n=1 Tax=Chitinophaga niastensis TaxID=536980 RepID=A0A2P8HMC7_CHINA|nr:HAMP domain-containing sensor histidine kinase [Chitinophaga niastensis]PSL47356.1 signal transduction histidine kinase [Chitinophaga niastensis]